MAACGSIAGLNCFGGEARGRFVGGSSGWAKPAAGRAAVPPMRQPPSHTSQQTKHCHTALSLALNPHCPPSSPVPCRAVAPAAAVRFSRPCCSRPAAAVPGGVCGRLHPHAHPAVSKHPWRRCAEVGVGISLQLLPGPRSYGLCSPSGTVQPEQQPGTQSLALQRPPRAGRHVACTQPSRQRCPCPNPLAGPRSLLPFPATAGLRREEAAVLREVKFHLGSTLRGLATGGLDELCANYEVGARGCRL